MSTESYDNGDKTEAAAAPTELQEVRTRGGHPDDRSQPALPVQHRSLANPSPLGLLSFATGFMLSFASSSTSILTITQVYS